MPEKIILSSQNCPGCKELEGHLKKHGLQDRYRVIDIATEEGQNLSKKLGITHIPNCLVVRETPGGLEARVCNEEEFLDLIVGK
jgi:predicted DCC family thiol-disulfide oxidoreductase YuxK